MIPIPLIISAITPLLPSLISLAEGLFKKKPAPGSPSTGPQKKSFVVSTLIGILMTAGIVKKGTDSEIYANAIGAAVDAFVAELKASGKI